MGEGDRRPRCMSFTEGTCGCVRRIRDIRMYVRADTPEAMQTLYNSQASRTTTRATAAASVHSRAGRREDVGERRAQREGESAGRRGRGTTDDGHDRDHDVDDSPCDAPPKIPSIDPVTDARCGLSRQRPHRPNRPSLIEQSHIVHRLHRIAPHRPAADASMDQEIVPGSCSDPRPSVPLDLPAAVLVSTVPRRERGEEKNGIERLLLFVYSSTTHTRPCTNDSDKLRRPTRDAQH